MAGGADAVSRAFKVARGPRDDWFDPDLTVDTTLFLDPFRLLKAGTVLVESTDLVYDGPVVSVVF